uniref:Uncharacterized protein n=1 Tax=Leersia perrieri TaxID=77586 RepID=A0A0D9Y192_9ORYZ
MAGRGEEALAPERGGDGDDGDLAPAAIVAGGGGRRAEREENAVDRDRDGDEKEKEKKEDDDDGDGIAQANRWFKCPICFCPAQNPVVTVCGHILCEACLSDYMATSIVETTKCPLCQGPIQHLPRASELLSRIVSKLCLTEGKGDETSEKGEGIVLEDVPKQQPSKPPMKGWNRGRLGINYGSQQHVTCHRPSFMGHMGGMRGEGGRTPHTKTSDQTWQHKPSLTHAFPIRGKRYSCKECNTPGFDLCGDCYLTGSTAEGRFNQKHTLAHEMSLNDSFLFPNVLNILNDRREAVQDNPGHEVDINHMFLFPDFVPRVDDAAVWEDDEEWEEDEEMGGGEDQDSGEE